MSDFLCPIFLSEFFVRLVHVRFFLSDLFYPTCLCPIFCPLFLADLLSHFLCDFWSKKMEHDSSCIATFVMYYQCVSVFQYCDSIVYTYGCVIAAATSGFGRDPGTLRNSLRLILILILGEKSSSRRSLLFFVPYIFFRPFRLSLAPTICPWVSEDALD